MSGLCALCSDGSAAVHTCGHGATMSSSKSSLHTTVARGMSSRQQTERRTSWGREKAAETDRWRWLQFACTHRINDDIHEASLEMFHNQFTSYHHCYLPTEHSLFQAAHVLLSATEAFLSQDHACGTVCRLLYDNLQRQRRPYGVWILQRDQIVGTYYESRRKDFW